MLRQQTATALSGAQPSPAHVRLVEGGTSLDCRGDARRHTRREVVQSPDDGGSPRPGIPVISLGEQHLLSRLRGGHGQEPEVAWSDPDVPLASEPAQLASVTGHRVGRSVPARRVQVHEQVRPLDEEVDQLIPRATRPRDARPYDHGQAGAGSDECAHLELVAAGPQAAQADGALGRVLDPLPSGGLPLVPHRAAPPDPVVRAAGCGGGISIRAAHVPQELRHEVRCDVRQRSGLGRATSGELFSANERAARATRPTARPVGHRRDPLARASRAAPAAAGAAARGQLSCLVRQRRAVDDAHELGGDVRMLRRESGGPRAQRSRVHVPGTRSEADRVRAAPVAFAHLLGRETAREELDQVGTTDIAPVQRWCGTPVHHPTLAGGTDSSRRYPQAAPAPASGCTTLTRDSANWVHLP